MRAKTTLVREAADRGLPSRVIIPEKQHRGRPVRNYRVKIGNERDIALARRLGLPLHYVAPELPAVFGFPMTLRPVLVVWQGIRDAIDTELDVTEFSSKQSARDPRVEDLIIVLLRIDPFAARAIALRNPKLVDPTRLLKRVIEEGVEVEASLVRLQQVAPAIPVEGVPLSIAVLQKQDQNVLTVGLL